MLKTPIKQIPKSSDPPDTYVIISKVVFYKNEVRLNFGSLHNGADEVREKKRGSRKQGTGLSHDCRWEIRRE